MGKYPCSRASTDIRVCRLAEDGRHTVRYRAVCLNAAAPTWKWKSRLRDAPLLETATVDGLNPASQQLRHNWHSQSPPRRLVRHRESCQLPFPHGSLGQCYLLYICGQLAQPSGSHPEGILEVPIRPRKEPRYSTLPDTALSRQYSREMLPPSSGPSYTRPITACRPQALKLAKQARCSLLTAQDQSIRGHVCSDILAGQRAKETGRVPELGLGQCLKGTLHCQTERDLAAKGTRYVFFPFWEI